MKGQLHSLHASTWVGSGAGTPCAAKRKFAYAKPCANIPPVRCAWLALLLSGSVFLAGTRAFADECPDAEAHVAFVRDRLDGDAHDGRMWRWGWGLGYAALALGQVGLALTREDEGEQVELYVGAGKSFLGLIPVVLLPMPALEDAGKVRVEGDRCAARLEASRLLARSAEDEAFNRSWLAHTGNVAVNVGGLLIVGVGYDRWLTGTLGAVVGIAVGELQIYTRPTGSLRGRASLNVSPMVTSEAGGLALSGSF
jgi:hypothetical protein